MTYKVLKTALFSLFIISGFTQAESSEPDNWQQARNDEILATEEYKTLLEDQKNEVCGIDPFYTDEIKAASESCTEAKKELTDFLEKYNQGTNLFGAVSQDLGVYSSNKLQEHHEALALKQASFIKISIGRYVFGTFFDGLTKWVIGTSHQKGKFQVFAERLKPYLEKAMVLMITIFGLFSFFGKYQEYSVKVLKSLISFVIVLAFLEWETFNYWVFSPLLDLLIGTMKVLFGSNETGLVETIFGVDQHFDALFASIEHYDSLLEEKGAWYSFQIFKQLVAYLMVGLFAALYAIFTILIIVGFFGFMLLLGFAPIFMAIGIFNKGLFFAWLKATMNYFLIPIFTAAVMSVTISFIVDASDAIGRLSPSDSIFIRDVGFVFLVGIFSVGLHWKAPEFAAAISGGMASGAGSIVGTAASVGAAAWGLSKTPLGGGRNLTNAISGSTGSGMFGNQNTKSHQTGRLANAAWERLRAGGTK
jgi:hypothetical protein